MNGEAEPPERVPTTTPRVYVASLSDYNAGRLHGAWLEADQDVDALTAAVQEMLARSREPFAEEYAIHDYEGFGNLQLGEYETLGRVAQLGHGIAEHGEAFAAWVSLDPGGNTTLDRFERAYRGTWPSVAEYAEDLLADLGSETYLAGIPSWLEPYVRVDAEAFGRDLALGGDIALITGSAGTHIFERDA